MAFWNKNKHSQVLRIIKTARDKDSINKAAKNGLKPLIKKVEPSVEIRSKYSFVRLLNKLFNSKFIKSQSQRKYTKMIKMEYK
jgi:hypothetical protein